jgi:hypothetical protein
MTWNSSESGRITALRTAARPACLAAIPIRAVRPWTALWATPAGLIAAMRIVWAAESAQFFVAQHFAWDLGVRLQTRPESAVEFVPACKQQVELLMAGLPGALRLLTGIAFIPVRTRERKPRAFRLLARTWAAHVREGPMAAYDRREGAATQRGKLA